MNPRLADSLSPTSDVRRTAEATQAVKIVRVAILLSAPQLLAYAAIFQAHGLFASATILSGWGFLTLAGGIFLLKHPEYYRSVMAAECCLVLLTNTVLVTLLGGLDRSAGQVLWTVLAPVGTLVVFGPRAGILAFIAFAGLVGILWLVEGAWPANNPLPPDLRHIMLVLNILLTSTFLFGVLLIYESRRIDLVASLQREHDRAEELLAQMLPENIAERLKREGGPIADGFADVTVMFADISGFTELTPELPPRRLVELLNAVFSRFDAIVEKHGVEKIKTIGDAYMAVGGLSLTQNDHAQRMADVALEMIEATTAQVFADIGGPLRLRIGLHTGPVVGGVIGQRRFIYDVWGDTVNLASRMQTKSVPGRVQVSQATYRRLKREYDFEEGPILQLAGNREERAYYLIRRRRASRST